MEEFWNDIILGNLKDSSDEENYGDNLHTEYEIDEIERRKSFETNRRNSGRNVRINFVFSVLL